VLPPGPEERLVRSSTACAHAHTGAISRSSLSMAAASRSSVKGCRVSRLAGYGRSIEKGSTGVDIRSGRAATWGDFAPAQLGMSAVIEKDAVGGAAQLRLYPAEGGAALRHILTEVVRPASSESRSGPRGRLRRSWNAGQVVQRLTSGVSGCSREQIELVTGEGSLTADGTVKVVRTC